MEQFVEEGSIVRKIWGKSDTIIFIFAGASAEFALNRAVDWLFFTGKLPADPIGRLFSTVEYAQKIVFSDTLQALESIHKINAIHKQVENARASGIPDWAYRDVLYLLIDYSIRAYELLERALSRQEKEQVFQVFYNIGIQMGLRQLPNSFESWIADREIHLNKDLIYSSNTHQLFIEYRKHLGYLRFHLLIEAQKLMVPERVRELFQWNKWLWLKPAAIIYKMVGQGATADLIKSLVLPKMYKEKVAGLDR